MFFIVEVGDLELIKIRYNFQNFVSSWNEAGEVFTDLTKLVEAFGLSVRCMMSMGRMEFLIKRQSLSKESILALEE